MLNSILADCIARIKNGYAAGKHEVYVHYSSFVFSFLNVLKREGYIRGLVLENSVPIKKNGNSYKKICVQLSYYKKGIPSLKNMSMFSKPGCRRYIKSIEIIDYYNRFAQSGLGTLVLSTNKGVLAGHEAIKVNQGGELICSIF